MQPRKLLRVASPIIIGLLMTGVIVPTVYLAQPVTVNGIGDETTYYLLTDHLGSVDIVLDDVGNIVERRDFLPYGSERLTVSTSTKTDHKFTGKELDDETGLYYYGARYYDAEIGRFVTIDPAVLGESSKPFADVLSNPQALNAYSYVLNNPVKYVDPTGAYEIDVHMYLTTFLAEKAGFSEMDAFSIGLYDQMTDDDPETTPWDPSNSAYHFPSQDDLDSLAATAIETLDSKDIGHYLHATQDSYSHSGFSIYFGGHILFGHSPDKTNLDTKRANVMAEDSYLRLRLMNRLKNGLGDMNLKEYNEQTDEIWLQIRGTAYDFNAADTLDKKLDILNGEESESIKESE